MESTNVPSNANKDQSMTSISNRFSIAAASAFIAGASPLILGSIDPILKGALMSDVVSLGLLSLSALLGGIAWRTRGVV